MSTADEIKFEASPSPSVFVRAVTTPRGLPWDQVSAARLDAARAAPLPIASLALRLKRLEPWRPAASGVFAALYVRKSEIGEGFVGSARLGDRTVAAEFRTDEDVQAQAKQAAITFASVAVAIIALAGASVSAVANRAAGDQGLNHALLDAERRVHRAQTASALKHQSLALSAVGDTSRPLSIALTDLAWLSQAKTPAAAVEAFHWRPLGMGVETRGEDSPFTDDQIHRVDKPLRPGVWLWAAKLPAGGASQ